MKTKDTFQIDASLLEEPGVIGHILRRSVDLMRNSGCKLTDRFKLLRLDQLTLKNSSLGSVRA